MTNKMTAQTLIPHGIQFRSVLFLPPLPTELDGLFRPYYGSAHRPTWRQLGGWVEPGAVLCDFLYRSLFRSVEFPVYSPCAGLMLPPHEDGYGTAQGWENRMPTSVTNHAAAILTNCEKAVLQSVEVCYGQLYGLIDKHRRKLFSDSFLSDSFKSWVTSGTLDRFLNRLRSEEIACNSLSETFALEPIGQGHAAFSCAYNFWRHLEFLIQDHPEYFEHDLLRKRVSHYGEAFERMFHPERGEYHSSDLRSRIWNTYRDRAAKDPFGFLDKFEKDLQFSTEEINGVLFRVAWPHYLFKA
jgi:hypothetical protein